MRDRPFRRSRARRGDHQAPRAATPSPYGLPSQAATLGCERAGCAARRLTLERARCGREFPGELERIRVWFQDYKIPDGKPANKFGFDNQPQNKEFTLKVRTPYPTLPYVGMRGRRACPRATRMACLTARSLLLLHAFCRGVSGRPLPRPTGAPAVGAQVIAETHEFYNSLKSGKRDNSEGLALK